ncbi:MAG TPA: AAA family ATPase [Thermoanaerobaculia bacterium]
MDPHDNPYTPGAGVKPPALVGRDREIEAFGVTLARLKRGDHSRSVILDGLRGVGKTVLLNEFDVMAREQDWITSGVVECNEDDRIAALIAKLSHRTLRRLSRGKRVKEAVARAAGALKAFTLVMNEEGTWRFQFDVDAIRGVADSGDPETDIGELLTEIGAAAAEQGAGALYLLDELQFLSPKDLGVLATAMHKISQENTPVLLAAAGLPPLSRVLGEAKPYAERLFEYREIGSLPKASAAGALSVPAQRRGGSFAPAALELIIEQAGGYPYFLQQWGETIWDEAPGPKFTADDVAAVEEVVNDELDRRFFRDRYDKATEAERIYMAAMADLGDGPHSSAEIADHLGKTQSALSVRRAGLLKKGLIHNPTDHELDFTVPHFGAFMRRIHPFNRDERPRRGRKPRPPRG